MASKKTKTQQLNDEGSALNLADLVGLSISNWYWFVLCLLITCSAAYLYLRVTPPVYTRSTAIIVKDDTAGQSIENPFTKTRPSSFYNNSSLRNEMIAFQKPSLMAQVVNRLKLDYQYEIRGHLRNTVLYGSSQPITVEVDGVGARTFVEFRVRINDDGSVTILYDDPDATFIKKYKGALNKPIKTPVGRVTVHPSASFKNRTDDDITVTHSSVEATTMRFLGQLSVSNTDQESTVIDLSLNDVNVERADDVLNTLIAVYNDQWIANRNKVIVATNKFINERLFAIEQELGDVENEMTSYKISRHTLDFESEGSQYMGRSLEYENQEVQIQNQLTLARYFRDYITKSKNNHQTLPLSAGISNESLSSQVQQYNDLIINRSNLVASSTEENPLVSDIDKQLSVLIHGITITIDNHINTLNTQLRLLSANNAANNAMIDATPTKQKMFVDIERRRKIKESLYTYLLQTREQNQLNQAFAAYNTRVLQPANGSNFQSFPDVKRIWIIALVLGLGIPFGFIVLREWFNSKVRGRKDIEKLTVPFVGELPNVEFTERGKWDDVKEWFSKQFAKQNKKHRKMRAAKKKQEKDTCHVVVKQGSRNVINEAYRVLRTNLEFMIGQNPDIKVIMTTSANPGSGKTFISYNLALCMSLKRKKVIAIDLDLRRRSLSNYVNKPSKGIADYINGDVDDWHDLLVQSEESSHLFVLPVGTLPPNPAEILSYDRFAELINEIRSEYDYVFFDCPPVEIVADTSILAKFADISLFVIRVGLMQLDFLPIIEEYYNEHKFNNMGVILNGTLTANSRYGYRRYGYRYGYGYGYGYGGYGYYGSSYSSGYSEGYSHGYNDDEKK